MAGLLLGLCLAWGTTAKAQYAMGNTGLMNIPTADMQEDGTFLLGGNYLPNGMTPFNFNTGNYFANITFLNFVELSYRSTLLKTTRYDGKRGYFQQDRSMTARIRPLKEGKYTPALVIGTNDPFRNTGNNYYGSIYGVLTKGFSLTGEDRLAVTAGYFFPTNDHCVQKGVFGGVSYQPGKCKVHDVNLGEICCNSRSECTGSQVKRNLSSFICCTNQFYKNLRMVSISNIIIFRKEVVCRTDIAFLVGMLILCIFIQCNQRQGGCRTLC